MAKRIDEETKQKIIRMHLVDGIDLRELSAKFGVPKSTIHSWTKTGQIEQVKELVNQIVGVSAQFEQLDEFGQKLTESLAVKLRNISVLSADVAESEASSAKQLSAVKSIQILNLDKENPDPAVVAMIKVLGETVNDSMKPAFNLLSANKDFIADQNKSLEKPKQKYSRIERVIVSANETA